MEAAAAAFEAVLNAFLTILQLSGASGPTTAVATTIVNALEKLIPIIVTTIPSLVATGRQVLSILRSDDQTLQDRINELKAQIPADDAAFDAAADAAEANDAAS